MISIAWVAVRRHTLAAALLLVASAAMAAPRHVYLSWRSDNTAETITVNYQTLGESDGSHVYYDTVSHAGQGPEAYKFTASGDSHKIPDLPDNRDVHWVELTGLEAGKPYYFITGDAKAGFSPERKFKTIPKDASHVRFAAGGDMSTGPLPLQLLKLAASHEIQFCAIGGDLSYGNGTVKSIDKEDGWLDNWENGLVTPEGYTVPMVIAIGNHEVNGSGVGHPERAPFYFGFYAQEPNKQSYFSRRFGKDIVFMMLDTGHVTAHAMQKDFIEKTLTENSSRAAKFAIYHVPLFPAVREFGGFQSKLGRDLWMPLFDKYGLTAGFENHDHAYKRTHPIKDGRVDPSGTIYLGDGCFGQNPRPVSKQLLWYEAKAAPMPHFWLVDVKDGKAEYRAIEKHGHIFDVYPPEAEGAALAEKNYLFLAAMRGAPKKDQGD